MSSTKPSTRYVAFAAVLASACGAQSPHVQAPAVTHEEGSTHDTPHWGYQGEVGPDNWATLHPSFAQCGTGTSQSPVDIEPATATVETLPPLRFEYRETPLVVEHNGHSIQVDGTGNTLMVGDTRYELRQLHFHTPSEHTEAGRSFPLEAHFVHQGEDGTLAVVGVLFDEGASHPSLDRVLAHAPRSPRSSHAAQGVTIDPMELLPRAHDYFALVGSLTTPPCTEGVLWHLLKERPSLAEGQRHVFEELMGQNNRPTSPLNGRQLRTGQN